MHMTFLEYMYLNRRVRIKMIDCFTLTYLVGHTFKKKSGRTQTVLRVIPNLLLPVTLSALLCCL